MRHSEKKKNSYFTNNELELQEMRSAFIDIKSAKGSPSVKRDPVNQLKDLRSYFEATT